MIRKQVELSISLRHLIYLSLDSEDVRLLYGWGSAYATLVALPSKVFLPEEQSPENAISNLEKLLASRKPLSDEPQGTPAFTTGIVGHMNYEVAQQLEPSLRLPTSREGVPPMCFAAYDASISLHLPSGIAHVYAVHSAAAERLVDWFKEQLLALEGRASTSIVAPIEHSFLVAKDRFTSSVEDIRQRILAGDFFQANLTRMLSVELGQTSRIALAGFAERLLTQSQAPFGAILNFPGATVISASPERFFRIEPTDDGRKIFAEPIKGTRPRHEDPEMDEALKQDLLSSEKDRAENIMIADLVRNDLSRVCTDESIDADPVCQLRSFPNVHHLVTRVSGILREEVSNLEALLAQFPCGSITGAPKWAAMDAIAELEQRGRGIYCGAIGYFDDRGHADFSVAIRTAVASFSEKGTTLTYGTGGGITMLSDPAEEFTETEDKAAGFLRALQL